MPTFQVATEALTAAAALVVKSGMDVGAAEAGVQGATGDLAGTPAEAGFAEFVGAAGSTLATMQEAVSGLSRALNEAALAYQLADSTAARSLQVGGG